MNTVMIDTPFGVQVTEDDKILENVLASLVRNNTFCPNIDRIIFNVSKKRNEKTHRPDATLATTVYFKDGTKTTVKNSVKDKIGLTTEKVKLSDGSEIEVETASEESREIGLVYAILKRMICVPDEKGFVEGNGFGNFLRKKIASAYNQNLEEIKTKKEKEISRNRAKTIENNKSKEKKDKPSLRKSTETLYDALKKLSELLNTKYK